MHEDEKMLWNWKGFENFEGRPGLVMYPRARFCACFLILRMSYTPPIISVGDVKISHLRLWLRARSACGGSPETSRLNIWLARRMQSNTARQAYHLHLHLLKCPVDQVNTTSKAPEPCPSWSSPSYEPRVWSLFIYLSKNRGLDMICVQLWVSGNTKHWGAVTTSFPWIISTGCMARGLSRNLISRC